jgi:hypothetical protein
MAYDNDYYFWSNVTPTRDWMLIRYGGELKYR